MKSIIIIALLIATAYCATDWNKVLNNVVSIGIKNALAEGTLRTLYPLDFDSTQSRECCNKCNRKFEVAPSFFTSDDASSQLGGVLAQVYSTNQLLIGISEATGNDSTLFTQFPNGTFGGILVDASQAIADQISFILAVPVTPNITVIPLTNGSFFDSVVSSLANNTIYVFADVSYTFARSKKVDFTCFYSSPEKLAFYVNPNNLPSGGGNTSSLTLSSFNAPGVNVAVTPGTIYEQAARELLPNANITTYPDLNSLYAALQSDAQVTILPALNITLLSALSNATSGSNSTGSNSTSSSSNINVVQLNDLIFEYGTGVGFATLKAVSGSAGGGNGTTTPTAVPGETTAAPSSAAPSSAAPSSAAPTSAAPTTAAPSDTTAAPSDTTAAPTTATSAAPTDSTASPSTSTATPATSQAPTDTTTTAASSDTTTTTTAAPAARSLARIGRRNKH